MRKRYTFLFVGLVALIIVNVCVWSFVFQHINKQNRLRISLHEFCMTALKKSTYNEFSGIQREVANIEVCDCIAEREIDIASSKEINIFTKSGLYAYIDYTRKLPKYREVSNRCFNVVKRRYDF